MYERLTTRLANGGVGYDNGEYFKVCYPWNEHCLTDIDRMAIKLCDLEDKIEQGKILELPCQIGDEKFAIFAEHEIAYDTPLGKQTMPKLLNVLAEMEKHDGKAEFL